MSIVVDLFEAAVDLAGDVVEAVGDVVEDVVEVVVDTVEYVVENPVEVLVTVGAASVGIPPPVTAAAVTAAKGGDLEDIGKAALGSYAGQYVGSAVGTKVAAATSGSALQNVLTNAAASGSASATRAAIQGGDVAESFLRGAAGGAAASTVRDLATASEFDTQPFSEQTRYLASQQAGLDPLTEAAVSVGAATGRGVVSGDIGQELSQELYTAGVNAAAQQLKQAYQAAVTPQQQAGTEPVMVAGEAEGVGSLAAQPLLGEKLVDSRSFDFEDTSYVEHVYEGQNSQGNPYRYSIIVGSDGFVAYRYRNENNEDVTVDAELNPEIRDELRAGFGGYTDPVTGGLFIEITGVGDVPQGEGGGGGISTFLDLRRFTSNEGGSGRAVIGGGGYAETGSNIPFTFLGVDSMGNQLFDLGGDPFTLITLPNKERVLASNRTEVVLYPTIENDELKVTAIKSSDVLNAIPKPKEQGAAGGAGLTGGMTSEELYNLIADELRDIDFELKRIDEQERERVEKLQDATAQRERLSRLPERTRLSPEVQEMIDAEISLYEDQANAFSNERQALGTRREQLAGAQEGGITDQEIMDVLGGGGEGDGLPDLSGVGRGRGEGGEGRGTGGEGTGPGAGAAGTGEGGEPSVAVEGDIPPTADFFPSTVGRVPRPVSLTPRQVGQGVGAITGRKEPVFGGDPGTQQDVWNIRSLRLKRALGL